MSNHDRVRRSAPAEVIDPEFFKGFADPTRVALMATLFAQGGEANVGTLAESSDVGVSVVSRHLDKLARCGALTVERRGRERWYRLNLPLLRERFTAIIAMLDAIESGKPCC